MSINHNNCNHWCGTPSCFTTCLEPYCENGCAGYPGENHDPACNARIQIGETVRGHTNTDRVRTCGYPATDGTRCGEHAMCKRHVAFEASNCPGCGTETKIGDLRNHPPVVAAVANIRARYGRNGSL